jgi:hypothetical protein
MAAVSVEPTHEVSPPSAVESEIERRVQNAWEHAGFTTDGGGRSYDKMNKKAFAVVRKHVVNTKEDIGTGAISQGELYAEVFPKAPGADGTGEPVDEFDKEVAKRLERDVWGLTQPKESGYIQKELGEEGSDLMLVREKTRTKRHLDKVWVVYLTASPAIVFEKIVEHEAKAYEQKAAILKKQLDMVRHRRKELRGQIDARVRQAEKKTKADLAFTAGPDVDALPEAAGALDEAAEE